MFVGREEELGALESLYQRDGFQMAVIYGRRRVGKTTLIDEFVRGRRAIYFTAKQQSATLNLRELSTKIYATLGMPATTPAFAAWADALSFVAGSVGSERLLLVLDELPYAAQSDPSLPSVLQEAIDHGLKGTNVFLVLCGSNEGFMESEVLGAKSPLYGRRTGQIHLAPFDYVDSARMLPGLSPEDRVRFYAAFGGTPYYLEQVDAGATFEENVARLMLSKAGTLYEEPAMLMRQELREPATYNSVLSAIAAGATDPKRISEWSGVDRGSVGKYLRVLADLGLVERRVPFGENPERSRHGSWSIADPFFAFWYRFVGPAVDAVELGAGRVVAARICAGQALATYEGAMFERVCLQWLARRNREGALPLLATSFGRWWGTDPQAREKVDIDVIAADRSEGALLAGECKWRNSFDESATIEALEHRASLIPGNWSRRVYAVFSKRVLSSATLAKAQSRDDLLLVSAEDLF